MTLEQEKEIREFLESKGIPGDSINFAMKSITYHEETAGLKDSEDVKRGNKLITFEPNPGKAILTKVGETKAFEVNGSGVPIYKEDIEMIKRSAPLGKKISKIQKKRGQNPMENTYEYEQEMKDRRAVIDAIDEAYDIDPENLNVGPDTTECTNEISEEDILERKNWSTIPDRVKKVLTGSGKTGSQEVWKDDDWKNRPLSKDLPEAKQDDKPFCEKMKDKAKAATQYINNELKRIPNFKYTGLRKAGGEDLPFPGQADTNPFSYGNILKRMDDTHTRKNHDYGDAAFQGYKKYGDYYFLVQLSNKLSRLESLTIENKAQQVKDESIDDTLLDLANYAVMYLESRHRNG